MNNIYLHGFLENGWKHKLYYLLIYMVSNDFSQVFTFECICESGKDRILL